MRAKEEKHRLLIHVRPKKIILKSFLTMGQKMNNIASKKQWSRCILGAGNKTTLCMTLTSDRGQVCHSRFCRLSRMRSKSSNPPGSVI